LPLVIHPASFNLRNAHFNFDPYQDCNFHQQLRLSVVADLTGILQRMRKSAVIWSWGVNGLRLASGILLLPLLTHKLAKPEFGMYYVFLSITALQPFLDLGFSSAMGRFVAYAMAGATSIQAQGVAPPSAGACSPNFTLAWQILRTTRRLYLWMALAGCFVMGIWGTFQVSLNVKETASPHFTWAAWGMALFCASLELYSLWWNAFLYYMNRVQKAMQVAFFSYIARLSLACGFLLLGWGLASVPAAGIVGCLITRHFSRRGVLRALGAPASSESLTQGSLLRLMWPNSWRLALQLFSVWLRTNANTAICAPIFGLVKTGEYGLSVQAMNLSTGMASVWSQVKWPQVSQLRSAHNWPGMRRTLWPRIWLQTLTFLALAAAAIFLGPPLLKLLGKDKQMMSTPWLVLLAASALLDMTYTFWGTLLSVENRIPTLWPAVITNVACLGLAFGLSRFTNLGVPALVLAPLVSGIVFNFWYWPLAGARMLRTTWWRFMFSGPEREDEVAAGIERQNPEASNEL
jgi:O-antigen/teichoic acid export membrane protein